MTTIVRVDAAGDYESWLSACGDRDPAAVTAFYEHYRPMLERFARRNGAADPEGVADLAIFDGMMAIENLRNRTESSFRSYVFRAAQSRILSESRANRLELTSIPDEVTPPEPSPNLDDMVVERAWIRDLVETLTDDQKSVIRNRFFAGYSSKETARRMGKSPGAVRKLQHDAITKLRSAIVAVGVLLLIAVGWWLAASDDARSDRIVVDGPVSSTPGPHDLEVVDEPATTVPLATERRESGGADDVDAPGERQPAVENGSRGQDPIADATTAPLRSPTTATSDPSQASTSGPSSAPTTTPTTGPIGPSSTTTSLTTAPPSVPSSATIPISEDPAPPILPPTPPDSCRIDRSSVEISESDGVFAASYNMIDEDGQVLANTGSLVESIDDRRATSRMWTTSENDSLAPRQLERIASVAEDGRVSSSVLCAQTGLGDDDDDDDGDDD